jgi:hypothetical protein
MMHRAATGYMRLMLKKPLLTTLAALVLLVPAAPAQSPAQSSIALPDEFRPEGIAAGKGATFYVGSIPQGSVWRGSFRTGVGDVLVPPHPGRNHTGLKYDRRFDRLFVAGGASKGIYVYDATTGADVASYSLPDAGFVNDVVLTRRAAWFTDSQVAQLYRVDIAPDGSLSEPVRVPLSGDLQFVAGFNVNGIEALPGGRRLIVVQSNTGKLFSVRASTGETREIALDQPVPNSDGILLRGRRLYVVQNQLNQVAEIKLGRNLQRGRTRTVLRDARLDIPTTIAPFNRFVYVVNARFNRPDDSDDDVVRLRPRP